MFGVFVIRGSLYNIVFSCDFFCRKLFLFVLLLSVLLLRGISIVGSGMKYNHILFQNKINVCHLKRKLKTKIENSNKRSDLIKRNNFKKISDENFWKLHTKILSKCLEHVVGKKNG